VGGGSTTGNSPGDTLTKTEKTQPFPPDTPGYSICIHSPPGDLPIAGAVCPINRTPTDGKRVLGPDRTLIKSSFWLGLTVIITPEGVPVTVGIETVGSCGKGLAETFNNPTKKEATKIIPTRYKIFFFTNSPIKATFLAA
jgi:hypothetical protein